jgi:hypothetical protein
VGFSLALVVALVAISLLTHGMGAQASFLRGRAKTISEVGITRAVTFASAYPAWLLNALGAAACQTAALVVPPTVMNWLVKAGSLAVVVPALVVLAALLVLCARGRYRALPLLLTGGALFVGYFLVVFFGRLWLRTLYGGTGWASVPDRYTIFPTAMFVLALVAALDGLTAGRTRRMISATVAALLITAWSSRFFVGPLRDVNWPRAAAQLERKLAAHSRAPLTLTSNPAYAKIRFDPLRMAPADPVPASTVLARLGAQGAVRLQFTSSCDLLGGVELRLGAAAQSTRGALRMALTDEHGTLIGQQEIRRTELPLDGSWHGLYFEPVAGSVGKRYTLDLHAIDNDGSASITVLGRPGDPRPNAAVAFSGQALNGEASFRHGCAESNG